MSNPAGVLHYVGMTASKQFRVLADYEVNDPHPLILKGGTAVQILRNDQSWPGWLWVEAGNQAGWIPESFLEMSGTAATTGRDFNGRDLSARRQEVLLAIEEAPGWIFAENARKERGWFPLFNLRPCP